MSKPFISVIIPAFNAAKYLPAALESVLTQTFPDIEVLVVDDGSTDETKSLVRSYRPPVRYLYQANSGVAKARNRGIAESQGRYVAFLDADDIWETNKLERQLACLGNQNHFRAVYTAALVVAADLSPMFIQRHSQSTATLESLLTVGNVIGTPSSVLAERSLFLEHGVFDPMLSQCADWDMWLRLSIVTNFRYLDEPLIRYRQHNGNMSRNIPLLEKDSLLVLEKGFAIPALPNSVLALRRRAFAHNYMVLAGSYYRVGACTSTIRCLIKAIMLDIGQIGHMVKFPGRVWARLHQRIKATAE